MSEEVGVAWVQILPSMRGFSKAVERELGGLGGPAEESGKKTGKQYTDGVDDSFNARADRLGRTLLKGIRATMTAGMKPIGAAAAAGFAGQFLAEVGASLGGSLATLGQAAGGGLALLPAAALAGVTAMGSLKVAVLGVSDALEAGLTGDTEAFEEALKGLSPSAREVAREVVGLRDRLDGLKDTVQESFFGPLTDQIQPLAATYLPAIEDTLAGVAGGFGDVGNQISGFLQLPETADKIRLSLGFVREAIGNVTSGLGNLFQAFLPLITVGSTFLPGLTQGFGGATVRLAEFMREAERTGELAAFIKRGIDAFRRMWEGIKQVKRILSNVGDIISDVFSAGNITSGGILDALESITARVEAFVESAQGAKAIKVVFDVLGQVMGQVRDTIERVLGTIGEVIGPLMPSILALVGAFLQLKGAVIDLGLDIVEPAFRVLGNVLSFVIPLVTGLFTLLSENETLLHSVAIAIGTLLVPAFVAWGINAGIAAASTLLAIAPIVLLGAAIAGLAFLVITHFDTIKRAIVGVFNWVKTNWPLLLAILTGPFGIAVLLISKHWDTIKSGATAVKDWIVGAFDAVVSFVTGLPGRIASAASGMWDGITDAFTGAINSIIRMWNGLSFPSLTVGGQDPLGRFGPSLPEATIGGWELPNIPLLAKGGIVEAPTLAMVREGGEDEAVAPLSDLRHMIVAAVEGSAPAPAPAGATVVIDGSGMDPALLRWLRHSVRVQGGGDVQVALGQR